MTRDGHRCARIWISGKLLFREDPNQPEVTVSVSGDYYHALDIQRPLSLALDGTASLTLTTDRDGTPVTFEGAGPFSLRITARWIKIAGKAVGVSR